MEYVWSNHQWYNFIKSLPLSFTPASSNLLLSIQPEFSTLSLRCGYKCVPQWLNDKAHCLKCQNVLRVREGLHDVERDFVFRDVDDGRRLAGEVSTYKLAPSSAMESASGSCSKAPDGVHHWKYGKWHLVLRVCMSTMWGVVQKWVVVFWIELGKGEGLGNHGLPIFGHAPILGVLLYSLNIIELYIDCTILHRYNTTFKEKHFSSILSFAWAWWFMHP